MTAISRVRRLAGDIRATSAIEFAVISPVLFAILFGIITFGVHYAARIGLTYAAAEGGRAAVAGLTDDERYSLACGAIGNALWSLSPLVDPSHATVNVSFPVGADGAPASSGGVDVSIAYSDARFARMPFLPDLSNLQPVNANYSVSQTGNPRACQLPGP